MNAEIIAIGSELLLGQIVDSNSAWISQRLAENGINLFFKTIVGDNPERMESIIKKSLDRADIVITSGGIGPTKDDLTREIVAKATERKIITDQESINDIEERFRKRGFIHTKNNDRQAMFPERSIIIKNPNGTAPSFIVEIGKKCIICLPGVPFEMKWLVENEVIPYLIKKYTLDEIIHYKVLKTIDLGESNVDHLIGNIMENSKNPTVGVLAHPGQVDIRIAAKAKTKKDANSLIKPVKEEIQKLLGDAIFGEDEETLEKTIAKLLKRNNLSISTIENISGGAISDAFQSYANSKFRNGITLGTQNNLNHLFKDYKVEFDESEPIKAALSYAKLVKNISSSDIGLSYVGIVSGDPKIENLGKGESYFAIVSNSGYDTKHVRSAGYGMPDKRRAVMNALSLTRKFIINNK